jgi:hypothetical protein
VIDLQARAVAAGLEAGSIQQVLRLFEVDRILRRVALVERLLRGRYGPRRDAGKAEERNLRERLAVDRMRECPS